MGNRQTKNRFIYGASMVIFLFTGLKGFTQKTIQSIYLQNAFYQEYSLIDKEKSLIISNESVEKCDTLVGVIRPFFIEETKLDATQNSWLISSILSCDYEDGVTALVKVYKMKDTTSIRAEVFVFYKKDKCWSLRQIPELSNIQTAIQALKPDSFWAFYNSEPSGIKEIDAIKAKFKDADGILDIDKLGAYLATKPKELAKYCDY
jgi:hypothetical protein